VLAQRYRLAERVGGGAMGEVWRGTDQALARTVAVKIVRPELLAEPSFGERFLAEARTMARIRHPGVVAVHDYHSDATVAFLVMEFVAGESLARLLHRSGRLPPDRAMGLVAQAAEALQAAHDTGVVHRDVKPGNLLVTPEGTVVLTDFGIARSAAAAPLTATGVLVGTVAYLAPEQVLGKPATSRSDVYALGVVGYECLAGRRPFEGDHPFELAMKRVHQRPPPLPGDVPSPVVAVVERALAADPDQRWRSAAEFGRAAGDLAGSGVPGGRFTVPAPRSPEPTRRLPAGVPGSPPPDAPPPDTPAPASSPPPPAPVPAPVPAPPLASGYAPAPASGYGRPAASGPAPPPAYPIGGYQAPAPYHPPAGQSQNVLGLLGMIFGITSIVFSICCSPLGLPLGAAGIVLGALGMRRAAGGLASNRGMGLAGVICGAIGGLLSLLLLLLSVSGGFDSLYL
jgi:serine/threonine-protein kinase